MARALCVASRGLALRHQRARHSSLHVCAGGPQPESDARQPRPRPPQVVMRLTRRQVLVGAATSGLGAVGLYELVDRLTSSPAVRSHGRLLPEQHLLDGLAVMRDNGVAVVVPPLHHAVITAQVVTGNLRGAQLELEETLVDLERRYAPTPAGLGVTVAWGLPYFRRHVPKQAHLHLPVDLRASRTESRTTSAVADAMRFPSDPVDTILEANDVAVLLRSDVRANIEDGERRLFRGS